MVARIQRAWQTGEPWEDTFPLRSKDGEYRWFLSRALPVRDASGDIVCWFGTNTDITEVRQAEESKQLLAEASRVFAEAGLDPEAATQTISRHVAEVLGDGSIVFLVAEDGQRLELAGLYHPDPEALAQTRALLASSPRPDEGLVGGAFRSGEPVVVSNLTPDTAEDIVGGPTYAAYLERRGIRSFLMAPLRARGRVIGTLTVWRDQGSPPYTRQHQRLLQDLADRAGVAIDNARLFSQTQAAVRLRDEVLSAVSHDLKNPLTGIKGTVQLLQLRARAGDSVPRDRLLEALARIDSAATRMNSWIEELVDVARMQAGRQLTLRLASVDLVELAAQAVTDHQQATPHAIILETRVPRLVGSFDAARVRRVLDNLLSNAVKYSPGGQPVRVCVDRQEDAAGGWAIFEVRDQGVGIPAADLPHVFERFHRGQNVVDRVSGAGIGLAGARQIIEQHGGRIELESQEGQGSTFTVWLPLTPARAQGPRAA